MVRRGLSREPFEADRESEVVRTVIRHAEAVLGTPPAMRGEHYWTDCALLTGAGIRLLAAGPSARSGPA